MQNAWVYLAGSKYNNVLRILGTPRSCDVVVRTNNPRDLIRAIPGRLEVIWNTAIREHAQIMCVRDENFTVIQDAFTLKIYVVAPCPSGATTHYAKCIQQCEFYAAQ